MPRWPDHAQYRPALARLIIECLNEEDRPPRLAEIMAATGVGERLAAGLLREAQVPAAPGRPWTSHAELMPEVRHLVSERERRGRGISAAEVERKLGVGRHVAAALLEELGLAAEHRSDEELLPEVEEVLARLGDHWSIAAVARELRIHPRRSRKLLVKLGLIPDKIPPGHSAAGSTWWTAGANSARWSKQREG